MDYKTATRWLFSLINYEKTIKKGPKSLLGFIQLLSYFDYPEEKLKEPIIVRGTKGKGSTSMMLSQMLINEHKSTGLFTSPHLFSVRERIKVNRDYISKAEFAHGISRIFHFTGNRTGIRTYFEVLTLLAINHFINKKVEYPIFEAGLGGRLDTTRLIPARLHLLTEIGYDHTGILGNTLDEITFEKTTGIDKGTVITLKQHPKVDYTITQIAQFRKLNVICEGHDFEIKKTDFSYNGTHVCIDTTFAGKTEFFIPLQGRFLVKSATLACLSGIFMGMESCNLDGLKLPARFQKIRDKPVVIIDGSHNPMSILNLKRELTFYYGNFNGEKTLIFSMMKDKNIEDALRILETFFDKFVFTEANVPRSEKKETLQQIFKTISSKPSILLNNDEIIDYIKQNTEFVVITGSFFLAGDVLQQLLKNNLYSDVDLYKLLE